MRNNNEVGVDTYHNELRIKGELYNLGDYAVCAELKKNVLAAFEKLSEETVGRYES